MILEAVEGLVAARENAKGLVRSGAASGVRIAALLSDAADACLVSAIGVRQAMGWAIFAVGSTGRRDLSFSSDLDYVLAYHRHEPTRIVEATAELVRALWDKRIRASVAVYDLDHLPELLGKDDKVFASILDQRFVAGDPDVVLMPRIGVRDRVVSFALFLADQDRERHLQPNLDLFAAEPDIKSCMGGLRDLASVGWLSKIASWPKARPRSRAALQRFADALRFVGRRTSSLQAAREALLLARHLLATVKGNPRERLTRDAIASLQADGLAGPHMQRRLELARMEVALQRALLLAPLVETRHQPVRFLGEEAVRCGQVAHPKDCAAIASDPARLLRFVRAAAARGLVPGWEVAAAAVEAAPRPGASEAFTELLCAKGAGRSLTWLLETGLLWRFLPPLRRLLGVVPGDEVHAFTVGRHSTLVAEFISEALDGHGHLPAGAEAAMYSCRRQRDVLLLAALMHDLGKSRPGAHDQAGASLAEHAALYLGFGPEKARQVRDLCRLHMRLPMASVTLDCDDPAVARSLAQELHDLLDPLLLLALADQRSLGARRSVTFRETLLLRAWKNAREALLGQALGQEARRAAIAKAVGSTPVAEIALGLPDRYLLAFEDREILDHMALVAESLNHEPAIRFRPTDGGFEAAYAGRDELGLLARISGAMFLMGLSIQEARVFGLPGRSVLDIFRVTDPGLRVLGTEEARQAAAIRLAQDIRDPSISTRVRLRVKAFPPVVADADNTASERFTTVRVCGPDAPGLLWRIADTFYRHGLGVAGAVVTTVGGEARDTFFVEWGAGGGKVTDPESIRRLVQALGETGPGK